MTEKKRFTVNNDGESIIDTLTHRRYDIEEDVEDICDKMNDLEKMKKRNGKIANIYLKENEELKQENKRLKEILKIKRNEIINRVLALQEITDKYTNEVLFKNNVNPNDAVKQVLKEILSSKGVDDD